MILKKLSLNQKQNKYLIAIIEKENICPKAEVDLILQRKLMTQKSLFLHNNQSTIKFNRMSTTTLFLLQVKIYYLLILNANYFKINHQKIVVQ